MIEKERLQELIDQGATVWSEQFREKFILKDFTNIDFFDKGFVSCFYNNRELIINLNKVFETQEDFEWHREFGCIERTERLELPTWEEFYDRDKPIRFKRDSYDFYCCKIGTQIAIRVYYQGKKIGIKFMKPLTQENYTLACRKAKELFLGLGEKK